MADRNDAQPQRSRRYLSVCIAAALIFCLGVAAKLHVSSVGMWNVYLDRLQDVPGLVAGTPKYIRSDEWQLGTPWLLSQSNSEPAWPTRNPSVGAETSALLVGLPTRHWTTIFRPAHWGFFLFDFERGFSWFWMFRTVILFVSLFVLCAQIGAGSLVLGLVGALWIFFPVLCSGGSRVLRKCSRTFHCHVLVFGWSSPYQVSGV
jgi:hypothetical protein